MMRVLRVATVFAALLGVAATTGVAQEAGSIRGVVTAQPTLRPLVGAQVVVVGTSRGVLTNGAGEFLLVGVPSGAQIVRVQHLGYGVVEANVSVSPGGTTSVQLEMTERAIALDGIVVTGQPAETRRRTVGASVASIDAERLTREASVGSIGELLQGREAGVVGIGSSGTNGSAGTLVLRGMTSLTQSNAPAVYLDGVRLDASEKPLFLLGLGGQTTSRLNDINPADVERVEVVRGAAASALYGSEASNGVIQIFTKKGRPGENSMTASIKYGANRIPDVFPLTHPDPQYPSANDLLRSGRYQQYSLSLRGGSDRVRHYASGSYLGDEGSFSTNYFNRANGLLSLWLMPHDKITAEVTTNVAWSKAKLPFGDNHVLGPLINILAGSPLRGTASDPYGGLFMPATYVLGISNTDETYRFTGGVTVNHRPGRVFSQRATGGLEFVAGEGITQWPYAPNPLQPQGARLMADRKNVGANFDYTATIATPITGAIASTLSAGGQFRTLRDHRVYASGAGFPAPYLTLLGATTGSREIDEEILEYSTGGVFVQEQIGVADRLFVTAGIRVDGSSAFGRDFGTQAYPKLSASYVISDEPWFRVPQVSDLRVRAGYGVAGTQPGAFDAQRTYLPFTAGGGRPALHVGEIGNPNLAPERSREWEAGIDASLLGERLTLDGTYYRQTTSDALLRRPVAPSNGYASTELTNLGSVRNTGFELGVHATLLQTHNLSWSAAASYARNSNEVLDMGGQQPITIDRFGTTVREGYPIGGKWQFVSVGEDANGLPVRSDAPVYVGTGVPPHNGSFESRVGYGAFDLYATAQWAAGHVVTNNTRAYMLQRRTGAEYHEAVAANGNDPASLGVTKLLMRAGLLGEFSEKADWMKIREVGVSYTVPARIASGIGASRATLNLSGRNLFTFTGYSGPDPEVSATVGYWNTGVTVVGQDLFTTPSVGNDFFTVPQARQLVVGVDVQF